MESFRLGRLSNNNIKNMVQNFKNPTIGIANQGIGIGTNVPKVDITKLKMPEPKNVFQDIQTPQVTPTTPKVEVPTSISTATLTKTPTPTNVIDTSGILKNIQSTIDKYTAAAGANAEFVRGAIKASGQQVTPELVAQYIGKKLGDVISGLGIGEKITGFGVQPAPTIVPESQKQPVAVSKVETPQDTPKTAIDYINDLDTQADAMTGNIETAYKDAGVQTKAEEVNRLSGELAQLDTNQTIANVMKNVEAQDLKDQFTKLKDEINIGNSGRGIILGEKQDEINAKLTGLSSQDVRDLATYTLNRTNLAQQVQIAQGNYQIASDIAKESAESMKWAYQQKLDLAKERRQIDDTTYKRLQDQFDNDVALMKEGYVQIPQANLESIKNDIATGKTDGTLWQDPITKNWYKKPAVASDTLSLEEATALGVPYGTTKSEVAAMGIIPGGKSDFKIVKIGDTDYLQTTDANGNVTFTKPVLPEVAQDVTKATQQIDLVQNSLDNAMNLYKSSGDVGVGGVVSRFFKGTDNYTNLVAETNTLRTNVLTMMTDPAIKKFFGPQMSNADVQLMTSAGTTLNPELQDPKHLKSELERLQDVVKRARIAVKDGQGYSSSTDYGITHPEKEEVIIKMLNDNLTEQEIAENLGYKLTFNSPAVGETAKISQAIGQYESGGNYQAIGHKTSSGDQAYGKYQIMGNNIPSWSKEALGYSITKEQFLKNANLQDKIAKYKMRKYYDKYGTVEDVASMWFSGKPLSKAGNAKDVIGTSVPKYVSSVKSIYNNLT